MSIYYAPVSPVEDNLLSIYKKKHIQASQQGRFYLSISCVLSFWLSFRPSIHANPSESFQIKRDFREDVKFDIWQILVANIYQP